MNQYPSVLSDTQYAAGRVSVFTLKLQKRKQSLREVKWHAHIQECKETLLGKETECLGSNPSSVASSATVSR